MKKYIKFATVCLMGIALASCAEKEYVYTPGTAEDVNVSMAFDQARNIEADGSDISVAVTRANAGGDLTVNVALTDPSGFFTLADNTVKFASGEKTAYAKVSYNYENLVKDEKYNIEVAIKDENLTSNYGISVMPLQVIKAWKKLGKVQFYDDWFFGEVWDKELIQSPDGSETYRLLDPFSKSDIAAAGFAANENTLNYLEFSIDDEGHVSYGKWFNLGFSYSGRTCAYASPLYLQEDEANEAQNHYFAGDKLVKFCWYPILGYTGSGSYSWWGSTAVAYLAMPGCDDLADILGL